MASVDGDHVGDLGKWAASSIPLNALTFFSLFLPLPVLGDLGCEEEEEEEVRRRRKSV